MGNVIFITSGLIIGILLWQLFEGARVGLVGTINISIALIVLLGFVFPNLMLTFSEMSIGFILLSLGTLSSFYFIRLMIRKNN